MLKTKHHFSINFQAVRLQSQTSYTNTFTQTKKNAKSQTDISRIPKATKKTKEEEDIEAPLDYDSALALTGQGYFNCIALVACTLIFMYSLIEMVAVAYIIDPAECDLNLTVMQKTLVGSAIFFGIICTAICWGALGDTYGRKKVMLPTLFLTIIASFISSMCTVFWTMFVMRLLTGALVAASSATVLVYLGELHTVEHRDIAISYAITAVSIAFCFVPAFAWLIIPGTWSFNFIIEVKPWRVFMWGFGLAGLIGAVMLIFLPESPSFVLSHQGENAALPILSRMWHYNHLKEPNKFPVQRLVPSQGSAHGAAGDSALKTAFKDMTQLMRSPIRRLFLITHYCMFMVFLLANGVYLWMPGIFNLVLHDTKLPWTICTAIKSRYASKADDIFTMVPHAGDAAIDCSNGAVNTMVYPMAIIMEVVLVIPFVIITIVIHKFRKTVLYAAIMLPCAVGLATCVLVPQVMAAALLLTIGICSGSGATVLSALAVNAFPTSLRCLNTSSIPELSLFRLPTEQARALVMCTMYMMGQVGAILGNTFVGMAVQGPCEVIFLVMSALVAGSVLSILLLWPDLDEVKKIMEGRNFIY